MPNVKAQSLNKIQSSKSEGKGIETSLVNGLGHWVFIHSLCPNWHPNLNPIPDQRAIFMVRGCPPGMGH